MIKQCDKAAMALVLALLAFTLSCGTTPGNPLAASPATATVAPGATRQFSATLAGRPYSMVTWQVNGAEGGNSVVGTITPGGLYAAPAAQPLPPQVLVTARGQTGGAASIPATVTLSGGQVFFSNASLMGPIVFRSTSFNIANPGVITTVTAAGRFVADGNGHITAGSEDINNGVTGEVTTESFSGAYSVTQDGRGVMQWTLPQGSVTLDFVLHTDGSASAMAATTAAVGSGPWQPQQSAAPTGATVAGDYAFDLQGVSTHGGTTGPLALSGVLTLGPGGGLTGGHMDVNDQGTVSQDVALTGSYTFSGPPGRMQITLQSSFGTMHFAVYVASANRAFWVETDSGASSLAGESDRQTGGPFSNASLSAGQVFQLLGNNASNLLARAGEFQTGSGGAVVSGEYDENNTGILQSAASITGGTYQVGSDGRLTLTLDTANGDTISLAGALIAPGEGFLTGIDPSIVTRGTLLPQAPPGPSGSYSVADLNGTLAGVLTGATGSGPQVLLLASSTDGAGSWGGTADANQFGTLTAGQPLAGSYTLDGNGRGVLTIPFAESIRHIAFYLAQSGRIAIVNQDSPELLSGALENQFAPAVRAGGANVRGPATSAAAGNRHRHP